MITVIVGWIVGWSVIGAWRMATCDAGLASNGGIHPRIKHAQYAGAACAGARKACVRLWWSIPQTRRWD
jgi:hypothetical protein